MLKALMRVRLASLKSWFFGGTRKKKITRGRLIGMSALMLYAFCAIGFLLYSSFVQLATAYRQMGLDFSSDYADHAHLNEGGSAKFTAFLGDWIKTNYEIPDRRQEKGYGSWENQFRRQAVPGAV